MKVKVEIVDKVTLRLLEDAHKGDIISLEDIQEVDQTYIDHLFNEIYKKKLDSEIENNKQLLNLAHQKELADVKNTNLIKIKELENQKANIESKMKSLFDVERTKLEADYKNQIAELNNIIQNKENAFKSEKNNIELKVENKYKDDLSKKDNEIVTYKSEIERLTKDFELNLKVEKANIEKEKDTKINELQLTLDHKIKEYDELKRERSILGTKAIGEELEQWCFREYENVVNFGGFKNCTFIKDNIVAKDEDGEDGTKADFIFKVYADENHKDEDLLTSVCLEMKSENPNNLKKIKNSVHYPKLDKDRNKKGCTYALLVSTLEPGENDLPIFKVNDYEDMYVIRPQFFVSFLNIINSLALKYADLKKQIDKEAIEFKDKDEILREFEEMKEKNIAKFVENINKQCKVGYSEALKAKESSEKIMEIFNKIAGDYTKKMIESIQKYDIEKKIIKKIDKLDE